MSRLDPLAGVFEQGDSAIGCGDASVIELTPQKAAATMWCQGWGSTPSSRDG